MFWLTLKRYCTQKSKNHGRRHREKKRAAAISEDVVSTDEAFEGVDDTCADY